MLSLSQRQRAYPVIQYLNRAAGLVPADLPSAYTEKLRALLGAPDTNNPAALPLLADLLSIPLSEAAPAAPGAQRKAATLALIVEIMTQTSEGDPVLIVLEDAHWIDATTLDMITRLADSITRAPVLVVVTARPDFTPPWLSRLHATLIRLGRSDAPNACRWSKASPPRMDWRRKRSPRLSPRPMACRCSLRN